MTIGENQAGLLPIPVVTFGQTFQEQFLKVCLRKMRENFTQSLGKKLIGKFRQLEGLEQPFLRRHAAKYLQVYLVIAMFLDTDHGNSCPNRILSGLSRQVGNPTADDDSKQMLE